MEEFLASQEVPVSEGTVAGIGVPGCSAETNASDTAADETEPADHLFLNALCAVVREQRELVCLSQEELAVKAKLHRTYISDIERGIRNFSVKTLSRIAISLGLPAADLVRLAEERLRANDRGLTESVN